MACVGQRRAAQRSCEWCVWMGEGSVPCTTTIVHAAVEVGVRGNQAVAVEVGEGVSECCPPGCPQSSSHLQQMQLTPSAQEVPDLTILDADVKRGRRACILYAHNGKVGGVGQALKLTHRGTGQQEGNGTQGKQGTPGCWPHTFFSALEYR